MNETHWMAIIVVVVLLSLGGCWAWNTQGPSVKAELTSHDIDRQLVKAALASQEPFASKELVDAMSRDRTLAKEAKKKLTARLESKQPAVVTKAKRKMVKEVVKPLEAKIKDLQKQVDELKAKTPAPSPTAPVPSIPADQT